MRDAQIERLLGGYATNTLTESERQMLLEAALDDQEVFDALQDEQALRELLEDAGSRQMIEQAAKETRPEPARGWLAWPRFTVGLGWGLAGCAAAAGVLVFMLGPFGGQPIRTSGEVAVLRAPGPLDSIAPAAPATKIVERQAAPVRAKAAGKSVGHESHETLIAQPAPPPALVVAPQAGAQTALGGGDQAQVRGDQAQVREDKRVLPSAGFRAGFAPAAMSGAIPYSVVRRGPDGSFSALSQGEELQAGDAVRVVVRPPLSGSLTLLEQGTAGNWNTVQALQVTASREYSLPQSPIPVNGEVRLRLVMMPGEGTGASTTQSDLREAAKEALSRPKQRLASEAAAVSPGTPAQVAPRTLTTDITLVAGRALGR